MDVALSSSQIIHTYMYSRFGKSNHSFGIQSISFSIRILQIIKLASSLFSTVPWY